MKFLLFIFCAGSRESRFLFLFCFFGQLNFLLFFVFQCLLFHFLCLFNLSFLPTFLFIISNVQRSAHPFYIHPYPSHTPSLLTYVCVYVCVFALSLLLIIFHLLFLFVCFPQLRSATLLNHLILIDLPRVPPFKKVEQIYVENAIVGPCVVFRISVFFFFFETISFMGDVSTKKY